MSLSKTVLSLKPNIFGIHGAADGASYSLNLFHSYSHQALARS